MTTAPLLSDGAGAMLTRKPWTAPLVIEATLAARTHKSSPSNAPERHAPTSTSYSS